MHQVGVWEKPFCCLKGSDNSCFVSLQMVANLSACEQVDSEALVHCLRGKSEEEILAINKVRLNSMGMWDWAINRVWGASLTTLNLLPLYHDMLSLNHECKMDSMGD
jgi:hypothetical protein